MASDLDRGLDVRAVLYVAAICVAVLGLEFWREWVARDVAMLAAGREAQNLAFSLRLNAEDTFAEAESVLGSVVSQIEANGGRAESMPGLQVILDRRLGMRSLLDGIHVIEHDGSVVRTTAQNRPPGGPEVDDLLAEHATLAPTDTAFSFLTASSLGEAPLVGISRSYRTPQGERAGLVLATISTTHFSNFFTGVDVGAHGAILLVTNAGEVISRTPFDPTMIGRSIAASDLSAQLRAAGSGIVHYTSPLDGVQRIGGYYVSPQHPFAIVVALSEQEAVLGWAAAALQRLPVLLILLLGLGLLGMRLIDQVGKRLKSESALRLKNAEFRLLAESASDLIELYGPEGRIYSSPALERITGYTKEEIADEAPDFLVLEEDRLHLAEAGQRLVQGLSEQEHVEYRLTHKRGHVLWLETSMRVTPDDDSGARRVVAVTRDITERKQLEIRLSSMASVDSLTGLANRRALDAALAREIAAARRDASPLSVLMVDADRFKRFNDDYGHLEGDAALRAIAGILLSKARRPRDLAARYGGEEMLLLLPNTTVEQAQALGMQICQEVAALGIVHARNQPWNTVTVSIGVGSLDALDRSEQSDPLPLLQRADRCLYDAKAQGRNVCVAPLPKEAGRRVG